MKNYLYDENNIRLTLANSNGGANLNFFFLPGGPGGCASYFSDIINFTNLPGNQWLIDMPGNGDYLKDPNYNYDKWFDIFTPLLKRFENPVIVGHSFGGMFPFCFPELEDILKGFVILNSAPSLWMEEAARVAKELGLPDLTNDMQVFIENPNDETFKKAIEACVPYYFPKESMAKGWEMLSKISMNYFASNWWCRKVNETNFDAKWIPNKVPTLIIGGEFDAICPFSLFEKDQRFKRDNIDMVCLKGAGHAPWIEKPEEIKNLLENFAKKLAQNLTEKHMSYAI